MVVFFLAKEEINYKRGSRFKINEKLPLYTHACMYAKFLYNE